MLSLFKCGSVAFFFFLYTKIGKFCFKLVRLVLEIKVTPQKFNTAEQQEENFEQCFHEKPARK